MKNSVCLTTVERDMVFSGLNECGELLKLRLRLADKYVPEMDDERLLFWETIICLAAEGLGQMEDES